MQIERNTLAEWVMYTPKWIKKYYVEVDALEASDIETLCLSIEKSATIVEENLNAE